MRDAILVVMSVLAAICFFACHSEGSEAKQLVSRIYVGEFSVGSSKLDEPLVRQIFAGLSALPTDENYSVKLSAYTDNTGSEETNQRLSLERLEAVALTLMEINPGVIIEESVGYIYKAGQNEVNRRFAVIEFWSAKRVESNIQAELPLELSAWLKKVEVSEELQKLVFEELLDSVKKLDSDVLYIREVISGLEAQNAAILEDTALLGQKIEAVANSMQENRKEVEIVGVNLLTTQNNFFEKVKEKLLRFYLLTILSSLLLLAAILVAFKKVNKKMGIMENGAEERHEEVVTILTKLQKSKEMKITGPKEFTVDVLEKSYRVTCQKAENENGDTCFFSPFLTTSGRDIIRTDTPSMLRSLRGCLKKADYKGQKNALIKRGLIVEIGGRK